MYNIEFRKFEDDDFSNNPKCFQTDFDGGNARLIRHDNCGMILMGNDNPLYYFHNLDEYSSRWSGLIQLGDSPLSLQKSLGIKLCQKGLLSKPYGKTENNKYAVESLEDNGFKFEYSKEGCHLIDGNVLDVTGQWFPYGLICHLGSEYNIPFMHLPVHLKGTLLGKNVEFLACIDRIFAPNGQENEIIKNATSYISSYCSGIREDGRREWMMGLLCHENGKGLGIYWIDGEDPIITDEIVNEGIWERLPYVNDNTVVCIDNIWKFGGKEFHIKGKWGSKGFTDEPRFERHGQSQMFGTWYEGNEEYKHRIWNTFNENMDAYYESMIKRGFKVKGE
jgi:hypothetical protein